MCKKKHLYIWISWHDSLEKKQILLTGLMSREFTNGQGDQGSFPGRVISKTLKNGTWCSVA